MNWKMFDDFSKDVEVENDQDQKLIDIGSCGLHTMHNAYKLGMTKSEFDIGSFLSSLYYLFKDSPVRREDFMVSSKGKDFPLKYCGHRWLENVPCIERAISLLPAIQLYISNISTEPKCKSFLTVKECMSDKLLKAKLEASLSLARTLQPFLTKYQTDAPMLPFLGQDLFKIIKRLLSRCLKPEVIDSVSAPKDVLKLNLNVQTSEDFLSHSKIDIGTGAVAHLRDVSASKTDYLCLRLGVKRFIVAIVSKLMERSPLKYSLVRNLYCLDPKQLIQKPISSLTQAMNNVVDNYFASNRIAKKDCDSIKDEYRELLNSLRSSGNDDKRDVFLNWDKNSDSDVRLDHFLHANLKDECPKLWDLVKQLLLLSHGNAVVERGFSVNKEVEVENLKEHSLIAQRRILDLVRSHGGPTKVPLTAGLLNAAKQGRQNYQQFLEDQKKEANRKTLKRKKDKLEKELDELKEKAARLEGSALDIEKEMDRLYKKAEEKSDFSALSAANGLREKMKENRLKLKETNDQISQKRDEMQF